MNHQMNIDEAIAIAKEYHLEAEVTKCINLGEICWFKVVTLSVCLLSITTQSDWKTDI